MRRFHTLHNDARRATLSDVIKAKDNWLAKIKLHKVDPKKEIEAQADAAKIEGIAFGWCFEHWLSHTGKRRKRALSPRSIEFNRSLYKLYVERRFGSTPITQITKADVAAQILKVKAATTDPAKGKRGLAAKKTLTLMHSVFAWAIDSEIIDLNPCARVPDPVPTDNPAGKQTRAVTDAELREFWREGRTHMSAAAYRVIQLAFLLGRRVSEIAEAERHEALVDQNPPALLIPATRTGNKAKIEDHVPLPPMALQIVRDALKVGQKNDPLFVGAHGDGTASAALRNFRKVKHWPGRPVLHDARTYVNGHMARMRVPDEIRSRTFQHTGDLKALVNTVYSAYDHADERMRALRLWDLRLRNIVAGAKLHTLRW